MNQDLSEDYDENHNQEKEVLLQSSDDSSSSNYDSVINSLGHGKFHWWLLIMIGWAVSSDTIEIVSISFVLPAVECYLGINSFEKGLMNSVIFLGMMFGGFIWGLLGDRWGRKRVLVFCLTINGVGALCSSLFGRYFWLFLILRFISGIGVGGSYPVAFSYLSEFQASSHRGFALSILCSLWMIAGSLTALVAWLLVPIIPSSTSGFASLFPGWRIFIAVCTFPALSSALLVALLLPESPKFLLLNGKKIEALSVLRKIASINGSSETIDDVYLYRPPLTYTSSVSTMKEFGSKFRIMFSRTYRRAVISVIVIFATLSFGFYGLLLWLPELYSRIERNGGGSICQEIHKNGTNPANSTKVNPCSRSILTDDQPYWQALLVNLANLPGNLISVFLIDRVGRKVMLCTSILLTAVSTGIIPFLNTRALILTATCIFGCVSAAGFNALSVVSTEVVPTSLRSTTIGFSGAIARLAAISGNLAFGGLIDVHCAVPIVLAAGMLFLGAMAALFLPKTDNVDML